MTKIKRAPKRTPSTHAGIAAFITALNEANSADDELPSLLGPIVEAGWTWPRTDLQHWIVPLNRFDALLDKVVIDYDLGSMEHAQTNAFTPRTKQLVLAILAFEKVLLENSTNRKIFASFDRLNDLLHTTDLDVLHSCLRLGLRPAQMFSSTNSGLSSFGIAEKRLLNLAQGWGTREYGLEMVDLADDNIEVPPELDETEWQFYKKASSSSESSGPKTSAGKNAATINKDSDVMEVEDYFHRADASTSAAASGSVSTPAPKPRAAFAPPGSALDTPGLATPGPHSQGTRLEEGLESVPLSGVRTSSISAVDLLVDLVEQYGVPEPDRLDLLQKIRILKSLGDTTMRRQMLVIRLLAIAVFAHTATEASAQSKLFLYEPELIPQLAELVHPDRSVPIEIQAAAFYALDALAKFKTKLGEVASALNAGVSHGILMYVVRRTVTDLEGDTPSSTPEFIDALFNILMYFQTNSFVGNMIVGAGIVSMLVEFIKNQRRDRVATVTKAVVFLDSLMYGYSSAFTLFISAGGLAVFIDRIKSEIELCIAAHSASDSTATSEAPTGLLSFEQAALLKGLLRAIQRLMQTAGTTEGLRNLIDSSLLSSVKLVMENRQVFGPQIFALSINITATFIHNEPTCLTTIQEAKVPGALYDALEQSVPASIDVLQAIPNAAGALCLNPPGLKEFNDRGVIDRYFSIFHSEKHIKVLQERDNGNMLGSSFDELVRHHPSLKKPVLENMAAIVRKLRTDADDLSWRTDDLDLAHYALQEVSEVNTSSSSTDTTMTPAASTSKSAEAGTSTSEQAAGATGDTENQSAALSKKDEDFKENIKMQAVDAVGRFLEGMFQNMQHCRDFAKLDVLPDLISLLDLSCMPLVTPSTAAFSSISALFRMLSEVKPVEVAKAIVQAVRGSLDQTTWFWEGFSPESRLLAAVSPPAGKAAQENDRFRPVTVLLSLTALLSDIYSNLTYTHGKQSTAVLDVFTSPEAARTLADIGQVYRVSSWEGVLLKRLAPPATPNVVQGQASSASTTSTSAALPQAAAAAATASATVDSFGVKTSNSASPNLKVVQEVMSQFPMNIMPIFQATIKLFVHRRSNDAAHRRASNIVAATMARIMMDNLHWTEGDQQDLSLRLSYSTLMLSATTQMIFDERPNMTGLQSFLLVHFERVGGLDAYLALYQHYETLAAELTPSQDNVKLDDVKLPIVHVFGGLKVALDLLGRFANHRTILEAPQTAILLTREKDKTNPDFFDPHAALVKLRAKILPVVASTWQAAWLRKSPPNVVRSVVATLTHMMRAEGEVSIDPNGGDTGDRAARAQGTGSGPQMLERLFNRGEGGAQPFGGAFGGLLEHALGHAAAGPPAPFALDQSRVDQLVDMGFPRGAVETALRRCRNNIGIATEYLLSHPNLDLLEPPREAAAAAAPPDAPAQAAPEGADAPAAGVAGPVEDAAPTDAQPEAPAAEPAAGPADDEAVPMDEDDDDDEDNEPPPPVVPDASKLSEEELKARDTALEEIRTRLNSERASLKPGFLARALSLAEDYSEIVFDIKGVFSLLTSSDDAAKDKKASLRPLIEGLVPSSLGDDDEARSKADASAAIRFRLLALLGHDSVYWDSMEASREELMQTVSAFRQYYMDLSPSKDNRPKWLASYILVAVALLAISEVPKGALILPAGEEPTPPYDCILGPGWETERRGLFELAMDLLAKDISDRETLLSTLRLLLFLTRDGDYATRFVEEGGLKALISSLSKERPEIEGCRGIALMIIRHVMEDRAALRIQMQTEIERWFKSHRSKVADVTVFLRGTNSLAARDVETFLVAVKDTCKLVQADASSHYNVALQNDQQEIKKPTVNEADIAIRGPFSNESEEATKTTEQPVTEAPTTTAETKASDSDAVPRAKPVAETALQYLMLEVMNTSVAALAPVPPTSTSVGTAPESQGPMSPDARVPDSPKKDAKDAHIPVDLPLGDYFQTTYTLGLIAELLANFAACKTSFLAFSIRKSQLSKDVSGAVKPRASYLYYLLNDLLPLGTMSPPTDFDSRRRAAISQFVSLTVGSLCHDPGHPSILSEKQKAAYAAELTNTRKTVLDCIVRAFKDANSSTEPTEVRYGRLLVLSNLTYQLLTAAPIAGSPKATEETAMQMAKLMLEKNFAGILTNALADVDLNFPGVNNLINAILRSLEHLTKVVTKVGRSKTSVAAAQGGLADEESTDEDSFDEEDDMSADSEEEDAAPDLYRNSALGMYEGELEPGHNEDSYMTGDSAEEFDEDDEMMDEMDDGVLPGSDVSDVSDDDEAEAQAFADEMEMMDAEDDDMSDEDDDDDDDDDEQTDDESAGDGSGDEIIEAYVDEDDIGGENEEWYDEDDVEEEIELVNGDAPAENGALVDIDEALHALDPQQPEGGDLDADSEDPDSYTDEEEMYLTGELEIDPEMVEPARLLGGPNGGAFRWDALGGPVGEGSGRRGRLMGEMMQMGGANGEANFFGDRPRSNVNNFDHPLLNEAPATDTRLDTPTRNQRNARGPEYEAWANNIEQMLGPGGVDTLQELLGAHGLSHLAGPDQLRVGIAPGPDGTLAMVIDPTPAIQQAQAQAQGIVQGGALRGHGHHHHHHHRSSTTAHGSTSTRSVTRQLTDRLASATEFYPKSTISRWSDECRVVQGSVLTSDRTARLVNHAINVLHAPARRIAKEAKERHLERIKKDAEAEMLEMETREADRAQEDQERENARVSGEVPDAAATEMQVEPSVPDDVAEVMNLARSLAAGLAVPSQPTPPPVDVAPSQQPPAEPVTEGSGSGAAEAVPAPAASEQRITISIHGEDVDITDTGIDPTFLEALPDDMREEVLSQHHRETRSPRRPDPAPDAPPSQINAEFLDALPPDLRDEVLRQEAAEQRREQAAARAAAAAAAPSDDQPDAAEAVQDDEPMADVLFGGEPGPGNFLRESLNIPPTVRRPGAGLSSLLGSGLAPDAAGGSSQSKKTVIHREAIQLLDKSGLATLVRLLFFPQPLRRNSLQKVLVNLCENSRTRTELINLLLTILQDGTRDVSAVDKSFSQMSLRANKSTGPKETPRRKVPDTPGGALPHFPGESVPNLIAQRCLEALMYLVSSNDQSPLFFLTEQEIVVGLSRRGTKKGKGKEKAQPSMTYPLIVLLGLLDRPALLKTQSMMDSLTSLLSAITKPLSVLQKKTKEGESDEKTKSGIASASAEAPDDLQSAAATAVEGAPAPGSGAQAVGTSSSVAGTTKILNADILLRQPPQIPAAILRLVVNILDAGECSSKTFQQTLILIQNLSYLPEAREVISQELQQRAQALADSLLPDLNELCEATTKEETVRGVTLAKFSPASSVQAKFLRMLKTVDWVNAPPKKATSTDDTITNEPKLSPEEEKSKAIFDDFKFSGLWERLGTCLESVEARPDLLYLATVLLPLIESLMVVSKYVFSSSTRNKSVSSPQEAKSPGSIAPESGMESVFLRFTDQHKKILNTMVKNNPSLLSGSFSILVHNPKVLEFENKRSYFFSRLHDRNQRQRQHYGTINVNVRRQNVFEDSFRVLQYRTGDEIKYGKLNVKFAGEEGVDAGGVTREWFSVLARQMFNPNYALFQPQAADALTYQPNKSSSINREHLFFFKFVGRIIGKALHDQRILEAYFSRSVYKHMLGKRIDHNDLESIDPEYHKSLVWMLNNDIDGVIDLTFSTERDDFGVIETIDLIPNGRNIAVTNENKGEYVRLITDQRLSVDIKDQMDAMLKGLYEIVPKDLLRIFSEKELELLISGLPEIDVDEWRANTVYQNLTPTDPVVLSFWRCVRSFSQEERAKLLQFVSGSSRVPLEGFAHLQGMSGVTKFSITSAGTKKGLPTAHTCFNQLDLSTGYESYEDLRKALLTAITEGATGFGFA